MSPSLSHPTAMTVRVWPKKFPTGAELLGFQLLSVMSLEELYATPDFLLM
eukprot:CAMPEP_0118634872 /NCGR_PEP_ID=MMETSP0785-20121206/1778_1 /TAXON_ID=91992 /ORGANISM="Bolidomonas pacifica, Strain CCMP 1866" /LENGTH=49 /DNA_ID=CAMNT_0006525875 /DNA_START=500 /DNA_END=649 /DNA_ORIENTATION=-